MDIDEIKQGWREKKKKGRSTSHFVRLHCIYKKSRVIYLANSFYFLFFIYLFIYFFSFLFYRRILNLEMDPTNANEESCSWKLLVLFCSFKILATIKLQARPMRIYGDILVDVDYRIFFFFFCSFIFVYFFLDSLHHFCLQAYAEAFAGLSKRV